MAMTKKQAREIIAKMMASMDSTALRKSQSFVDDGEGKKRKFSISKYMRGGIYGNWDKAEFEHEQFVEVNKTLTGAIGIAAGFLITPQYSAELIELLRANAIIRNMGPRVYPMSGDTLTFNRQTGATTAYWVAEGDLKQESDPAVGQASLVLKEVAGIVRISNNLLEDASPAVDALVRGDLVKVLTLAEDLAFIQGTGGGQPLGIINDPAVPNTTLGGGAAATPTFDDFYDALYAVEAANAKASGWVMHPRTKNTFRKIKDADGNYIYRIGDRSKGDPDTLLGLPVGLTTQIPINLTVAAAVDCSYVILADWGELAIGEKSGGIKIDVSTERYFETDETAVRAVRRVDGIIQQPNAFYNIFGVRP